MTIIPVHNLHAKNLKRVDFDVITLGEKENYSDVLPHRHNFYELMVFTEGSGKHEIDFNEYDIEKNSVHFVSPTQVHKLKSANARGYVICFREEFLQLNPGQSFIDTFQFYDFTQYSPVIKMEESAFGNLAEISATLNSALDSKSTLKREILSSYLNIALLKIKEFFIDNCIFETNSIATVNPKIQEFKKLIAVNYLNHYTAFQYAGLLNISTNYLNALSKKETGRTATDLIHERILLEAKRLLYATNLSVKEISSLLHFDTDAYFVRFFKKNVGQTPLDYRNSLT
ncbi:MAG TPA: helix-turn-helix domain-containing protein [Bacteroidia bacterium]|nr:helix-turn-helix domain-containing protein [Bacteroidia bacterium]